MSKSFTESWTEMKYIRTCFNILRDTQVGLFTNLTAVEPETRNLETLSLA